MTAIEQLQAAITERRQQLAGLEFALAILEAPPGTIAAPVAELRIAEPAAKKPCPPAAPQRPEGTKPAPQVAARHEANREKRRADLARRMLTEGPMALARIEAFMGGAAPTIRAILDSPYFVKTNPTNRLSPWTLTESGRKLAASAAPG